MKVHGRDRGGITLAVVAPILAAIIGGGAAIGAAYQIVNLAPSNSDPGPEAAKVSQDTTAVQYGGR